MILTCHSFAYVKKEIYNL